MRREAPIIDPVLGTVERYLTPMDELGVRLDKAVAAGLRRRNVQSCQKR